METLSFDLLQFLYHLALAVLVGGSLVLGTAAAPALFASSRSRADAGTLFGSILARFDGLAVFSVIVLVITSVLKAVGFEELPQSSPARIEFARLHQGSRRAMSVAVGAGLVALFLS